MFVENHIHLPLKQKRFEKLMQKCNVNTKFKGNRADKENRIGDSEVCGMLTEVFCPFDHKDSGKQVVSLFNSLDKTTVIPSPYVMN